jgi:hypothetical protein
MLTRDPYCFHFDGDFYEQLRSVLPIFSGEAKILKTSMRKYEKVKNAKHIFV